MTVDEKTETFIDRTDWPSGPWDDEPDRVEWRDEATGLPCLALRNERFGSWCAYVAVPPGHPLHGVSYGDAGVEVHGGLTFAGPCMDYDDRPKREQVCHVPAPGEPDDVWWLGFDFAHGGLDIIPRFAEQIRPMRVESYKRIEYVKVEAANVARQLGKVGS